MLALLKKDIFTLKRNCAVYVGIMMLFYIAFGIFNDNFAMYHFFFILITLMLPVTAMSFDEKCRWDLYGMSMPISRRAAVLSKYLLTGISAVFGIFFGTLVMAISALMHGEPLSIGLLAQPLAFALFSVLIADFALPIMFHFGTEKGRLAMVLIIWGIALVPYAVQKFTGIDVMSVLEGAFAGLGFGVFPSMLAVAAVVATLVSSQLSITVYQRKELH